MTTASVLPHFDAVPLFSGLGPEERSLLAPHCRVHVYERGETIFEEGDPAADLSFVVIGRVKIVKATASRDVILGLFGPGEPVGAVAAFEGKRFPAAAIAIEPTTVLHVPERTFFATLDAHPVIVRRLLQGLMLRQVELTRRLADLTGPVEYRVARVFLTLAERAGRRDGSAVEIPIVLSRQEVADLAATTIESAIRVLSRWGKDGRLVTHAAGFTIPDLAELRRITET